MDTRDEPEVDEFPITDIVDPNNKRLYTRAISDTIQMRDIRTLEKLLKLRKPVDSDERYPYLSWPLHIACVKGHLPAVKLLLKYGQKIEQRDSQSRTPLIVAIDNRELECAKFLVEKGANINAESNMNKSALMHAVYKEDTEMVELLVEHKAELWRDSMYMLDLINVYFPNLIRSPKALKVLCEHNLNYERVDSDKKNILMWMVSAPKDQHASLSLCIPILAKNGIDLEAKDNHGMTALAFACEHGNSEAITALLVAGASLKEEGEALEGCCLLFRAIKSDSQEAVSSLLQGAPPGALKVWQNETKSKVLHVTMWKDDVAILKILLEHSWPHFKTGSGEMDSLLHLAAGLQGRRVLTKHCFEYLLELWQEKKYSVGLESRYSCTPLYMACTGWNLDEVEMLLKAGADPTLGHRDGTHPMTGLLRYALFPNTHWFPHVQSAIHPSLLTPSYHQDPPAYPVLGSATLLFDYKCRQLQVPEILDNLLQNAEQACDLVRSAGRFHRSFVELDVMCDKVHLVVKDLVLLLYSSFTGDKYADFYVPLSTAVSAMPSDHTLQPLLTAADSWVKDLGQPCLLKRLCRDSIRSSMHPSSNPDTIGALGLPQELEKYVLICHEYDLYIHEMIEVLKV